MKSNNRGGGGIMLQHIMIYDDKSEMPINANRSIRKKCGTLNRRQIISHRNKASVSAEKDIISSIKIIENKLKIAFKNTVSLLWMVFLRIWRAIIASQQNVVPNTMATILTQVLWLKNKHYNTLLMSFKLMYGITHILITPTAISKL